jgi:GH25 family lysozyme M1 (1,4-beta-N-acetylmuramidase)
LTGKKGFLQKQILIDLSSVKLTTMKPAIMILMLIQCFYRSMHRTLSRSPSFSWGGSIKSDKSKTINQANLIRNLPTRGILRLKVDNDKRYGRYGIDISHHQGDINWKKIPC